VAWTAPARAQEQPHDTGFIGGGTHTDEIDRKCPDRTRAATSDAQRDSASEHYQHGSTMYVQGDFENAIEEFVAAYCDAPHPDMLKNIAQSYERLLDFEKAVAYFSRYILELPPDATELREQISFRVDVLSKLQARIQVATEPAGASVVLTSDTGTVAQGIANSEEPILVRKGTYEMRIELSGHEVVTRSIDVKIGQPYSYYFRLEPLKGQLRVITEPGDARIFIDKRLVAIGSYTEQVPIGSHAIAVESPGWQPRSQEVEVNPGAARAVVLKLDRPPRSGRSQLLVASTIAGAAFGGGALTTVFEQGPLAGGGGALVGLAIGFGGGYFGVPRDISVGHSSYIINTSWIGGVEGAGIASLFACDSSQSDGGPNCQRVTGGAALLSGVGGTLFGALTADRFNPDSGDAALLASGGIWGSISGLLFVSVFENDTRLVAPLGLAGLNLGITAGALLARRMSVSRGHMALIDLAGLAGMIAGVALVDVVTPGERGERLPHFALIGMTTGLITGAYLTRNMDEPKAAPLRNLSPAVGRALDRDGRAATTFGLAAAF
jgi:hypothetical protein